MKLILVINGDEVNIQKMSPELDVDNKFEDYMASTFNTGCLEGLTLLIKYIDFGENDDIVFELCVYDKTKKESDTILINNEKYIKDFVQYLVIKTLENVMEDEKNDNA